MPPDMMGSARDENDQEEFCAVCHDGGDLLYCCDRCTKIYHLYCYIPPLTEEPFDDWVRNNLTQRKENTRSNHHIFYAC